MRLLDRLELKYGHLGIPNLTLYLIGGQVILYVLIQAGKIERSTVYLAGALVQRGEWWRIFSFILDPPVSNLLFAALGWYIFYMMGTALESQWGAFRYTLYLLLAWLLTVGVAFIMPLAVLNNSYIGLSVFLAFAFLYPDFTLLLFFVLPVKMRWISGVLWLALGFTLLLGDWSMRLLLLASVGNFLLFFGAEVFQRLRHGRRRRSWQGDRDTAAVSGGATHRCTVCGITDLSHPEMDFRYCSKCEGAYAYCTEHLKDHEHITRSDSSGD